MNFFSNVVQPSAAGSSITVTDAVAIQLPEELEPPLRLLLYFDIFTHPLSFQEIHALGYPPGTPGPRVQAALDALLERGVLERQGDLYYLAGREEGVTARLAKAAYSRALWQKVPLAAGILSAFPFVRGIAVTGTLAKDAAGPGADIDFLVFTGANRVWLCRSLIAMFRKLLPGDLRQFFCANVFLAEDSLTYDQRNMYIAVEIALSRPVVNPALGQRFWHSNPWIRGFLPGINALEPPAPAGTSRSPLEKALEGRVGDWLERQLAESWQRFWTRKYDQLSPDQLRRRFRVQHNLSTNHFHDFQTRTLAAYQERLERFGLAPGA